MIGLIFSRSSHLSQQGFVCNCNLCFFLSLQAITTFCVNALNKDHALDHAQDHARQQLLKHYINYEL